MKILRHSRTRVQTVNSENARYFHNRLRSRTRIATIECHILLSFNNRLHSRTRVKTVNYQSAWHFHNPLHSRTRITTTECKILLSLNNRLLSRTRIKTVWLSIALLCAIQCVCVRVSSGSSASICVYVSSVARLCIQRAMFRIISLCLNPNFFEILSESSRGISVLPLPRPIYRWYQAQVGKSSASEIGVLRVALRDIFWNLRCHHRGMKGHEIVT